MKIGTKTSVYLGLAYALIFTGYYVATSFLSILYPTHAFLGFVTFYSVYCLMSFVAPFITHNHFPSHTESAPSALTFFLMPQTLVFLGSLMFIVLIICINSAIVAVMIMGCGLCGAGNAFLWFYQGVWISKVEQPTMPAVVTDVVGPPAAVGAADGKKIETENYMGIFYGVYNFNLIFGNLLGLAITLAGQSVYIMLWIMIIPIFLGGLMILFRDLLSSSSIVIPEKPCENRIEADQGVERRLLLEILRNRKFYMSIGLIAYQAFQLNITYLMIPTQLSRITITLSSLDQVKYNNLGFYLAYGVFAVTSSFIWGKCLQSPTTSLRKYVIIGVMVTLDLSSLVMVVCFSYWTVGPLYWIIFIGSFRGAADYGVNSLLNIVFPAFFNHAQSAQSVEKVVGVIFSLYRVIYSASYVGFSLLVGFVSEWPNFYWVCFAAFLWSIVSFVAFTLTLTATVTSVVETQ